MTALDLVALRTFVSVCELGNLTGAARLLGMTQAAVSQRVKKLEGHVGARLIDRDLRPVRPTPAGQLLYDRARGILAELGRLDAELRERSHLPLSELRLGVADSLGCTLVPPLVDAIKGSVARLAVRVDSSVNICRSLLQRDLHAVISSDPLAGHDELERYELYREPMVLVWHRAEPVKPRAEPATLEWLARNRPFIRYSPVSPLARQIETHLRRLGVEPPYNLEFNASEAILEMVHHRLGWTITTPLCLLQGRADFRKVAISRLPLGGVSRSISLLARRHELGLLPRRLSAISCGIIDQTVVRRIGRALPWALPLVSATAPRRAPPSARHNGDLG